jgi:prepilin-type processing-associated H-X9-DG protein
MSEASESPAAADAHIRHGRSPLRWLWRIMGALILMFLLASVLLPSLCRSAETANLVKCSINLKQIGMAIDQYARDHNGQYPDSFATVLRNEDLVAAVFNCPSSGESPAEGATPEAIAANLGEGNHLSYIYAGRGMNAASVSAATVMAYEPLSNHGLGMNVLYGDGHVEWVKQADAERIIAAESARAGTQTTQP